MDDHAGAARAHGRNDRLRHRDEAEHIGLEQRPRRLDRRRLERVQKADAGIVDEDIDRPGRSDGAGNAGRVGHVEGQQSEAVGGGQQAFLRVAHGGDDAPAALEEIARDGEAEAGRAAGDENGLHKKAPWGWSLGMVAWKWFQGAGTMAAA